MPVDLDSSNSEDKLSRGLPKYLPRGKNSANRILLRPVANQLDDVAENVIQAEMAVQIQRANTIPQLAEIGRELESLPWEEESLEHYRARLLAESQLATSKGTIEDVIEGASSILNISSENIVYESPAAGGSENGTVSIRVPSKALNEAELQDNEIASYIDKLASAGARVEALVSGTFTYITPADYDNSNHDETKGYDGLDTDGNPKNNGGTYSGLVG